MMFVIRVIGGRRMAKGKTLMHTGCQAHHLVPGTMSSAKRARDILKECKIDINSPAKGVWLPGRKSPSEWAGAVHNGPHFKDYGTMVSERLEAAYFEGGKSAVERTLQQIREELFVEGGGLFGLI